MESLIVASITCVENSSTACKAVYSCDAKNRELKAMRAKRVKAEEVKELYGIDSDEVLAVVTYAHKVNYNGLDQAFVDKITESRDHWLAFCQSMCVTKELQPYMAKNPFDVASLGFESLAIESARNYLQGRKVDRDRVKSGAFVEAVDILVGPLKPHEVAAAVLLGLGANAGVHYCLNILTSNCMWSVEKHSKGVDMRSYGIAKAMPAKGGVSKIPMSVYRMVLPAHRRISMDDVLDWAFQQNGLIPYETLGHNCKRMCWDFFCDFNIDVSDFATFSRDVEDEYATVAEGREHKPEPRPNVPDFFVTPEDASEWTDILSGFLDEVAGDAGISNWAKYPVIQRTVGGADMVRRLKADVRFVRRALRRSSTGVHVDDGMSRAFVNALTVLRAVLAVAASDLNLLRRVTAAARYLTRPWADEMERMGAFNEPPGETVAQGVARLQKFMDFSAIACKTGSEVNAAIRARKTRQKSVPPPKSRDDTIKAGCLESQVVSDAGQGKGHRLPSKVNGMIFEYGTKERLSLVVSAS